MTGKYKSPNREVTCRGSTIVLLLVEQLTGQTRTVERSDLVGVSTSISSSWFDSHDGFDLVEQRVRGGLLTAAGGIVSGVLRTASESSRRWADDQLERYTAGRQPNQPPTRFTTD